MANTDLDPSGLSDSEKEELKKLSADQQAVKDGRNKRLKDAWGRPKLYVQKIDLLAKKKLAIINSELDYNKQINELKYRKEYDLEYTQEQYDKDTDVIIRRYYNTNEFLVENGVRYPIGIIPTLEAEIVTLKEEINALDDNFFGLIDPNRVRRSKEDKKRLRELRKKERKNKRKNKTSLKRQLLLRWRNEPNKFKTVVNIISYIANIYIEYVGVNNAKIDTIVDEVNILIDNIKTADDVKKAKIQRDLAVIYINLNKNYLEKTAKLLNDVGVLNNTLSTIVSLMLFLPPTLYSPQIERIIKFLQETISDLSSLFTTGNFLIQSLQADLNDAEARLKQIGNILDLNLSNLTPEQIQSLQNGSLGYLFGYDYKGFKFYLREEEKPEPKNVIKGTKRRYAAAVDTIGKERIRSEYSFTLDPDVLIEQLKLEIDKQNLLA